MQDWALILGASSGFGAATCRELAGRGVHIYGIHLDRKAGMDGVSKLVNDLKKEGVQVYFNNMNATDAEKRRDVIDELKSLGDVRVKILMHSLAFGTLKPIIDADPANRYAHTFRRCCSRTRARPRTENMCCVESGLVRHP